MSRFTGFQNDGGVAVLDTVTGSLVYYPFDGETPRVLSEAVVAEPGLREAPRQAREGPSRGPASPSPGPRSTRRGEGASGIRAARRLDEPRPMVIRYPDADEVAAFKAARLTVVDGEPAGVAAAPADRGNGER